MTPDPKFNLGGSAPPEGERAMGRLWRLLKRFVGAYTTHTHPTDPVAAALVQPGSFAPGTYDIAGHLTIDSLDVVSGATSIIGLTTTSDINISNATGKLKVNGTQVITARQTGWTAATGTPNLGAFATSTATTLNCAERIKALEDALRAHGLIN